ncbi:MAG: transglycosylase SLT domain-containing protein [Rhodospirillaceae bacterium]|nr:transglycosylase SLT domain-containing protein [Rhodospirillaceae bacterium]
MAISRKIAGIAYALAGVAAPAFAQNGDIAPESQCLRFLQSYERSMRIPQGLLTAISYVESGRRFGANNQVIAWPWTINVNGQGRFFETKEEAVAETRKLLDQGQRSIDVGCMQVNLRYHPNAFRTIEDAFEPATNIAYGAQFLNSLHDLQGSWTKAIERYHSSDDGRREEYREKVLAFWNNDARNMVMNAVLAENTDTPYHRAVRDYAAGQFNDALDKYQAIVDANPKDRIGLLGVAMTYEQLGRVAESNEAYARYLVLEPESHSVLTHLIQKAKAQPASQARADLDALARAGINNAELMATLAELASAAGDDDAAFTYAASAIQLEPSVSMHYLNAGVLADRLKRPAAAVAYYEQFLTLFELRPAIVDTSISGVRDRVRYLRSSMKSG